MKRQADEDSLEHLTPVPAPKPVVVIAPTPADPAAVADEATVPSAEGAR
jgi:hypothetical protein